MIVLDILLDSLKLSWKCLHWLLQSCNCLYNPYKFHHSKNINTFLFRSINEMHVLMVLFFYIQELFSDKNDFYVNVSYNGDDTDKSSCVELHQ